MRKRTTVLMAALTAATAAAPISARANHFSLCLKAYSDAETKEQADACPAIADALNGVSGQVSFDARCVTGSEVFNRYGCGAYDVAIVGDLTVGGDAASTPVSTCLKASSDAETPGAAARCESLAGALNSLDGGGFGFDVSCHTGRDSFYKYGCGVYDAALAGKIEKR